MPYIADPIRREQLDRIVDLMHRWNVKADGDLNYILYAYAKRYVENRYSTLKNFIAEITESAGEIRRRMLFIREDQAIEENGDVE